MITSIDELIQSGQEMICVRIVEAKGSTPREAGAEMHVSTSLQAGSIGGGRLEWMATQKARDMLRAGINEAHMDVPLGPEIGQCCGGRVTLKLVRTEAPAVSLELGPEEISPQEPAHVYIFGAGHVGTALARACAPLPLCPILVDSRATALEPELPGVEKRLTVIPEAVIKDAPPRSIFVILTHDHGLDFQIADAALARGDAAYVGMIGSATKRLKFEKWQQSHGEAGNADALICPIGADGPRDKRPEVIAAMTAAELLTHLFDQKVHAT